MTLTPAQQTALLTDINANGDTAQLYADGNLQGLADLYNATASPTFWVWRTSVSKAELVQSVSVDGTTFTWVGNGFITRSAGEQAAWSQLFNDTGLCNPSLANVRQAFTDIFSGTGNAASNRTHLATVSRRAATRFEKLFATGVGNTANPGVMALEGPVSYTLFIGL